VNRYVFFGLLAAGIAFRILMLTRYELVNGGDVDVYLADEGVVGLMGKHILEGRELPVFFYGQDYLGALEAYCAAASFALFGVGLTELRLVPFVFSLAVLAVVYRLAYVGYSVAAARWATALAAIAPMYFLQWNLKARGGFVEHVFLLLAVLALFWRFHFKHERQGGLALGLGLVAGVALWVNQLVAGYLFVLAAVVALSSDRRRLGMVAVGALLGSALLIGHNVVHPLATARALARKAVVLNRVPIEERDEHWVVRGVGKRVSALEDGAAKLGLVFGVPPGADVERLGLSEEVKEGGRFSAARRSLWWVPAALFGTALLAALPRRGPAGWEPFGSDHLLVALVAVTFVVGYVSPRYMLPAYPLAAVLVGALAARLRGGRKRALAAGFACVLALNVAGWADAAAVAQTRGEEARARLLSFLNEHGLDRCYSAAPMYHLVFRSNERTLLVPLQKDRYPAHNREVEASPSICYVFREDQTRKRQHVAMMELLEREGVAYRSAEVGEYRVLWSFSPRQALSPSVIERIRSPRDPSLLAGRARGVEEPWT
jgi:4-amino-4-deoxy-L-arabinose transferase-like glycosyltransferase